MHLCEHILGFNTAGYRHFTLDAAKEFCQKIAAGEIDPEALLMEFAAEDMAKEQATVKLAGGNLQVNWDRKENLVYMAGPAVTVFEGEIALP